MTQKTYQIEASMMQAIVGVLAGLPWGQVNNLMSPLQQTIQAQDAAPQTQELSAPAEQASAAQ